MEKWQERTEMLIGEKAVQRLTSAKVIAFGVGGVGGYAVEALARAGVGHIALVDSDCVSESNINRQIVALRSTVGKKKTAVAAERIRAINPNAEIEELDFFFENATKCKVEFTKYDYIVDAIDSVKSKILLIKCANEAKIPIISCMGTGNKLDPTAFYVTDISKTEGCPLARAVRTGLRKEGINHLKVVFSKEKPIRTEKNSFENQAENAKNAGENLNVNEPERADGKAEAEKKTADFAEEKRTPVVPASISFVPPVAGFILAGEVIKDLILE